MISPGRTVILPIGRLTIDEYIKEGENVSSILAHDPAVLRDCLFELFDTTRDCGNQYSSKLHVALRIEARPDGSFRMAILEFNRKGQLCAQLQKRSLDSSSGIPPDKWIPLEHENVITFVPTICRNSRPTPYAVFSFQVDLPLPPEDEHRDLHLKFLLPGRSISKVIGTQGRVLRQFEQAHEYLSKLEIADRHDIYPGTRDDRAVMISAPSPDVFLKAVTDFLIITDLHPAEGLKIALPNATEKKLCPNQDTLRHLQAGFDLKLSVLEEAETDSREPLQERLLLCTPRHLDREALLTCGQPSCSGSPKSTLRIDLTSAVPPVKTMRSILPDFQHLD